MTREDHFNPRVMFRPIMTRLEVLSDIPLGHILEDIDSNFLPDITHAMLECLLMQSLIYDWLKKRDGYILNIGL